MSLFMATWIRYKSSTPLNGHLLASSDAAKAPWLCWVMQQWWALSSVVSQSRAFRHSIKISRSQYCRIKSPLVTGNGHQSEDTLGKTIMMLDKQWHGKLGSEIICVKTIRGRLMSGLRFFNGWRKGRKVWFRTLSDIHQIGFWTGG